MILQVIAVGFAAIIALSLIRKQGNEFAVPLIMVTVTIIFALVINQLGFVMEMLKEIANRAHLSGEHVQLILKIIGIAYIAQLGAEIARDSGENAIASKIEMAGKIIILFHTTPVIYSLINLTTGILP